MLGSRLTQWTLLVGLTACTSDPKYTQGARPMDTIGAATGTGDVGTSTGAVGTVTGSAGTGGRANTDASGGSADRAPEDRRTRDKAAPRPPLMQPRPTAVPSSSMPTTSFTTKPARTPSSAAKTAPPWAASCCARRGRLRWPSPPLTTPSSECSRAPGRFSSSFPASTTPTRRDGSARSERSPSARAAASASPGNTPTCRSR